MFFNSSKYCQFSLGIRDNHIDSAHRINLRQLLDHSRAIYFFFIFVCFTIILIARKGDSGVIVLLYKYLAVTLEDN